jgi:hypothetical protein
MFGFFFFLFCVRLIQFGVSMVRAVLCFVLFSSSLQIYTCGSLYMIDMT